jgi:hypothetical protein
LTNKGFCCGIVDFEEVSSLNNLKDLPFLKISCDTKHFEEKEFYVFWVFWHISSLSFAWE